MSKPSEPLPAAIELDVAVDAPCWDAVPDAEAIVRRAVEEAALQVKPRGTMTIVLTDDDEIRALNNEWRGFDKPTNVLSFPAAPTPGSAMLGDVIIAYETVQREAADEKKPFAHHLSHLAVHGFLHLLGHDHDNEGKARLMEDLERKVLANLGIPDPYGSDAE